MPNLSTPATYENGVIKPLVRPDFDIGEIIVTFIPSLKRKKNLKRRALNKEDIFEQTFGILPRLPDGVSFTNKARLSWDKRYKKLWKQDT